MSSIYDTMPRASSAGQAPFFSPRGSSARCRKRSAKLRRGLINALFPKEDSFPLRSELINLLQGLRCDVPPVFLDLDLGEMLLRTDLPPNFTTDDVRWSWPGFRIMMPRGWVSAPKRQAVLCSTWISAWPRKTNWSASSRKHSMIR